MKKKIYFYQGKPGGIPGLAHAIDKSVGDQMIKDYERARKEDEQKKRITERAGENYIPAYLDGMPGYHLKAALERKIYIEKEIEIKDQEPPKEAEKEKE